MTGDTEGMSYLKHSVDENAHERHVFTVKFRALLRDMILHFLTSTGFLGQQKYALYLFQCLTISNVASCLI